jgi:hypothetical protein
MKSETLRLVQAPDNTFFVLRENKNGGSSLCRLKKISLAMRSSKRSFLDGIANSVNLDSGFFARAARSIYTYKIAAFKRNRKIGRKLPAAFDSIDIIRSHCPTYVDAPYGSRTRISTCASIGLIDSHVYFSY